MAEHEEASGYLSSVSAQIGANLAQALRDGGCPAGESYRLAQIAQLLDSLGEDYLVRKGGLSERVVRLYKARLREYLSAPGVVDGMRDEFTRGVFRAAERASRSKRAAA